MLKGFKKSPYEITMVSQLRTFCRILVVLALVIDLYLAYAGISGDSVVGCGPDSDCDKVLQSKWSKLFGIPVSLFALPLYVGLIYSVGLFRENIEPRKQRYAWRLTLFCSFLVLGAAIWFTFLQIFIIKSICSIFFCFVTANKIVAISSKGICLYTFLTIMPPSCL